MFKKFNVTAILFVLLIIAAFLVGSFYTRVQMLEQGINSPSSAGATPTPVSKQLSNDKFNEVVKDAILVFGDKNAKVKLVEFTDFECPYCASFFSETLPQIEQEYGDKIAYYLRHFPLYSIHANAENASLASECAKEQGKFREMHDLIFQNQRKISANDLKSYAVKLGLKIDQFNTCFDSQKYKDNVDRDAKLGGQIGVGATPTFFLNGRLINGAQPFSVFQRAIEEELK